MKVLVTGAAGFVGRNLVNALIEREVYVVAASRKGVRASKFVTPVSIDLSAKTDWVRLLDGVDAVVHLASIVHKTSGVTPQQYDQVNRQATADLAEAARSAGVKRMIFVSTIAAQIGTATKGEVTEFDMPTPETEYGKSKLEAERAVESSGVPFTIIRPVVVYGSHAPGNPATLKRIARLLCPLPFGSFSAKRSMVSVDNLVSAIIFCLDNESAQGETYLVSDGEPLTLAQIVTLIRAGEGRKPGLIKVPESLARTGMRMLGLGGIWQKIGESLIARPSKLMKAGWMPPVSSEDGLRRFGKF